MKRLRHYLAVIALGVTLIGPTFLGIGAGSLANVASSQSASSPSVAGKVASSAVFKPSWPCPVPEIDC